MPCGVVDKEQHITTSSDGCVQGTTYGRDAAAAEAQRHGKSYSEWRDFTSIWIWSNSHNRNCRSFLEHRWSSAQSPKPADQRVPGGGAITSASLHRAEMHVQSSQVPAGSCHQYRCIWSSPELDPEQIAHRPEVQRQSSCHDDCWGWDHSDSPFRLWCPCPWAQTVRWHWSIPGKCTTCWSIIVSVFRSRSWQINLTSPYPDAKDVTPFYPFTSFVLGGY